MLLLNKDVLLLQLVCRYLRKLQHSKQKALLPENLVEPFLSHILRGNRQLQPQRLHCILLAATLTLLYDSLINHRLLAQSHSSTEKERLAFQDHRNAH